MTIKEYREWLKERLDYHDLLYTNYNKWNEEVALREASVLSELNKCLDKLDEAEE